MVTCCYVDDLLLSEGVLLLGSEVEFDSAFFYEV